MFEITRPFSKCIKIPSQIFLHKDVLLYFTASLPDNFDALFGDADDSSNIFRDLDDIIGAPNAAGAVTDAQPETDLVNIEFSPDEEDVENQLMHIDDQLIRLDENIEDITDHLDEQLLNTATVENDALLSVEEENLLFSSMPEVTRLNRLISKAAIEH
jgi:hypothetical protein